MNSEKPDWRKLECGCWQRTLTGDIVTARFSGWVTVLPCAEHRLTTSA